MIGITIQGQPTPQGVSATKSLTLLVNFTVNKQTSTTITQINFSINSLTMANTFLLVTSYAGSGRLALSNVGFVYSNTLNAPLISLTGVSSYTFNSTSVTKVIFLFTVNFKLCDCDREWGYYSSHVCWTMPMKVFVG
jgi:hypothetical protein